MAAQALNFVIVDNVLYFVDSKGESQDLEITDLLNTSPVGGALDESHVEQNKIPELNTSCSMEFSQQMRRRHRKWLPKP